MAAGRKGKYNTHVQPFLDEILQWKKEGMKEAAIAAKLGVSVSSFELYKKQFSEFSEVIKRGDIKIAEIAEESLIQGIQGHFIEEVEQIIDVDGKKNKKQRVKKTKKWMPANPTLIIFALKNKKPEEWQDRTSLNVTQTTSETVKQIQAHFAAKRDDIDDG